MATNTSLCYFVASALSGGVDATRCYCTQNNRLMDGSVGGSSRGRGGLDWPGLENNKFSFPLMDLQSGDVRSHPTNHSAIQAPPPKDAGKWLSAIPYLGGS